MPAKPTVLLEDNHLLVVNKPAGIATQGAFREPSVFDWACEYLKRKYNKPGNVYLGIVSRLDKPVSGVLVLARTSKAAARLSEQFRSGTVAKLYWALVGGIPRRNRDTWVDWLAKSESERRVRVVPDHAIGAREARLTYRVLKSQANVSLIEIDLQTGRKHQIRVQASARDLPILGDSKYGSSLRWPSGIALHAREITFTHPVKKEPVQICCPVPRSWQETGFDDVID